MIEGIIFLSLRAGYHHKAVHCFCSTSFSYEKGIIAHHNHVAAHDTKSS